MKKMLLTCLLLGVALPAVGQGASADPDHSALALAQREQVEDARAVIEAWRAAGGGDERGDRPLVIALFTGSDTEPAPRYRERLTRTLRHIQAFYADEMQRHGFGPLTFGLQLEDDERLKVHIVRGDRPNAEYNGDHGREIRNLVNAHLKQQGIDGEKQTVVIFCNLTRWDPETRRMSHHSPYYARGSSREGTAWQLDSALLDAAELGNTDRAQYLRDGQYGHISLGRYQSIFVGGVCHELGHALGLPHNLERADERALWGTALMGSGNRTYGEELRDEGPGSFLTLAHAVKLASHPGFTGSIKQMNTRPNSRYTELSHEPIDGGKGLRIAGRIESDIPAYAVIAYLDPEGRSDYDATTHVAIPDEQGRFVIDCTSFAGKQGRVRLVRVHANGWAQFAEDIATGYTRGDDGGLTVQPFDLRRQRTDAGAPGDTVYTTQPVEPCPCGARH